MTISEILEAYPEGTVLNVWSSASTGRTLIGFYLGRFTVERRTIRHQDTGQTWGEVQRDFRRWRHYTPAIAKAVPVKP